MGAVQFPCSLGTTVELTDERRQHIEQYHSDVLPFFDHIAEVLLTPEGIRKTLDDPQVLLFYKFYADILRGKYFVVVVKVNARSFVLTAYLARRLQTGELYE
ncbi:MAG: hypothetical protein ACRERD_11135 [Candidatus Binatia bacterium]